MQVTLVPQSLPALDELTCDLLLLGCFSDERPLRNLAGLLDWRLNGWVSQLLLTRRFAGEFGELLLFPSRHRVGPQRTMLVGLGASAAWDESTLGEALDIVWTNVAGLKVSQVALGLPALARANVSRRKLVPMLVNGARRHFGDEESLEQRLRLTVMASPDEIKTLQATVGGKD